MATVRESTKSALLVVDVQVAVMQEAWESSRIISNVATAVREARSHGIPVIWIQHTEDELTAGSPGWELVPELSPDRDEALVSKSFASSFEETDLEAILADLQISHIVLTGAATNFCVRATAYGALDRGYDLTLVSDAHTTGSMSLGAKTIEAADIIDDLNAVMTWVKYPGRTNKAASIDEIDFARLGHNGQNS